MSEPVELPEEATETSETFLLPDGSFETVLHATAIHYRDGDGALVDIDSTLVAIEGGGWRNAANSYDVVLPATLDGPVAVRQAGAAVEFTLQGAEAARGEVSGSQATYREVLPGVSAVYDIGATSVKESLVLESPSAPSSFTFALAVGEGLRPAANDSGGVDLVGADGTVEMSFVAPYLEDAAGEFGPAAMRLTRDEATGGHELQLDADAGWLAAPDRAWPVILDPTVSFSGTSDTVDCYVESSQPTNSYCSQTAMQVGKNANGTTRTSLLRFPGMAGAWFHPGTVVTEAKLSLYVNSASSAAAQAVQVLRATRGWTTAATWNTWDGINAWSIPGGDVDGSTAAYTAAGYTASGITSSGVMVDWYPTQLVQDWIAGTQPNDGFVLKSSTPAVSNMLQFRSSEYSYAPHRPTLTVRYDRRVGVRDVYSFEERQLTDRAHVAANVANGNLAVVHRDLLVAGTGLDLVIDRFYNSKSVADPWIWTVGPDVRLDVSPDGSVVFEAPGGEPFVFLKKTGAGWFEPPGLNATLTDTGTGYTLEFRRSEEVWTFTDQPGGTTALWTEQRDRNGNTIDFAYNSSGQLSSVTDTQGRVVTATYTSGRLTELEDSTGREATYHYDGSGRMDRAIDLAGGTYLYGYDTSGQMTQVTTPRGNKVRFTYMASGGRLQTIEQVHTLGGGDPAHVSTFDYFNPTPGVTYSEVTDARGNTVRYDFDERERVTTVTDARGETRERTYTPNDDVEVYTDSLLADTTNVYDANSNVIETRAPASAGGQTAMSTFIEYDDPYSDYFRSALVDPQGNCTFYDYDDTTGDLEYVYSGRGSSLVNGVRRCAATGGDRTAITYNANGTVQNVAEPGGSCGGTKVRCTQYSYDGDGNRLGIDHPAPLGDESFLPDALSRVVRHTDGRGKITHVTYDDLDRIVQLAFDNDASCANPANCTTYTYDDDGNLTGRNNGGLTSSFTYDRLNRPTNVYEPGNPNDCRLIPGIGMGYAYDEVGNLSASCDAGGWVAYGYDERNQVCAMVLSFQFTPPSCSSPPAGSVVFTHDENGRRSTTTFPSTPTVTETMSWNPAGQLTSISAVRNSSPPVPLTGYSYTYADGTNDRALRRTVTETVSGQSATFGYDAQNRLCFGAAGIVSGTCSSPPAGASRWTYDAFGNRTRQVAGGVTTSYAYNQANQLCWQVTGTSNNTCASPPAGAVTSTYDGMGALTGRSSGFAASYNARAQASSMTPPGGTATSMGYADVGQTHRTSFGARTFANGLLGLTQDIDGSTTAYYRRDDTGRLVARTSGATVQYYLHDGLGSVVGLVRSLNGTLANTYAYGAWGEPLVANETVPNPWRYAGGFLDGSTGLTKFGARFYDPAIGRWTQRDPSGLDAHYAYAGNDPIGNVDPSGYYFYCEEVVEYTGPVPAQIAALRQHCIEQAMRVIASFDSDPSDEWWCSPHAQIAGFLVGTQAPFGTAAAGVQALGCNYG